MKVKDPDKLLDTLIEDVLIGNFGMAREALDALEDYRDNGGYAPADPREVKTEIRIRAWHRGPQK